MIKQKKPLEYMEIEKPEDIKKLISETINEVRAGNMDVKIANCIGFLSNHFLKATEVCDISYRIETIERIILERKKIS